MFENKNPTGDFYASRIEGIPEGPCAIRRSEAGNASLLQEVREATGEVSIEARAVWAVPAMRSKSQIRRNPQTKNIRSPTTPHSDTRTLREHRRSCKGEVQGPNQSALVAWGEIVRTVRSSLHRRIEGRDTQARWIPMPRVSNKTERTSSETQRASHRLQQEKLRARESNIALRGLPQKNKLWAQGMERVLQTKEMNSFFILT